jgi:BASS family bile acid:Na+ symporter
MRTLFSDIFLPVTLIIITLGMGLSLTDRDFKNIFIHPRAVITGLCCQMILLPIIAFLIAHTVHISSYFKVGLMIIAACPGGVTSNLVTYLLKGNVALSISMTALNSMITLITIPLVVYYSVDYFIHEPAVISLKVGDTILKVFLITLVPAFLGTRIRKYYPGFAVRLERPLRIVLPFLLLVVYAGVIFLDKGGNAATRAEFIRIFPFTLLLNILAMILGFLVARSPLRWGFRIRHWPFLWRRRFLKTMIWPWCRWYMVHSRSSAQCFSGGA